MYAHDWSVGTRGVLLGVESTRAEKRVMLRWDVGEVCFNIIYDVGSCCSIDYALR